MTLILGAHEVEQLSEMPALIDAVEKGVREEAAGQVVLPPRLNLPIGKGGFFRVMPTVMNGSGLAGFKVFHNIPGIGVRYLIAVYELGKGELLALMDAHYLTAARTGAATGVATKYMANPDASTVGVIGSGLEARTNLYAVCAVRKIKRIWAYSPNPERRKRYAERMHSELGLEASASDSPEEAVRNAEIVIVATNTMGRSESIAYRGAWMRPGQHVNAIGSTAPQLREIDSDTWVNAGRVVVDAAAQIPDESGDAMAAIKDGKYPRDRIIEMKDVIGGKVPGRASKDEITLFKSVGTGIQDVSAGYVVYQGAVKKKLGRDVGAFLDLKTF
jgi:alanine dehydrogenase